MATYRRITTVVEAAPVNMGGLLVKQPLPHGGLDQIDPFLLLHHARWELRGGSRQEREGVPPHPHRGFAPVTFIFEGGVHHRDSLGNDSVVYAGGVQWMTAGRGVIHSERPPREIAEDGGTMEFIQLWVNLPARHKLAAPRYQHLTAETTPTISADDGRARVQVVAGSLDGTRGPLETLSPVTALTAHFEAGGTYVFDLPEDHNAFVYLLDGRLRLNETREVAGEHLAALAPEAGALHVEATAPTRLLLMTGAPLGEPVAASGPFVMNTSAELYDALHAYQTGAMGTLAEDFDT